LKPPPVGWPRIVSAVYYEDAAAAIDWLCRVFGFEVRVRIEGEGGSIQHSELMYGEGMIMVGECVKSSFRQSPRGVDGGNTQNMMVFVDDADAHCAYARANGAKITKEPATTDYGEEWWTDRGYECEDLEGHHWWFYTRLREQTPKDWLDG
jgi:uncharacterized glyoxalase superfamily protein PhnB